jgi:hypothetical protein
VGGSEVEGEVLVVDGFVSVEVAAPPPGKLSQVAAAIFTKAAVLLQDDISLPQQ